MAKPKHPQCKDCGNDQGKYCRHDGMSFSEATDDKPCTMNIPKKG